MAKKYSRKFQGVWVPKAIWLSKAMTPREKLFLIEIDSLDNGKKGCWANNQHFCELFCVTKKTASRVIQSLIKKRLIISRIDGPEGNKRTLKVVPGILRPYPQECPEGVSPRMSIGYTQECPDPMDILGDTPIPRNVPHTIPIPNSTNDNTNDNTNTDLISDTALQLELTEKIKIKAALYELKLHAILPTRGRGEKTTFNRLREYLISLVIEKKRGEEIFKDVVLWAKEAIETADKPRAMLIAKCKQELGFEGKGSKLLEDKG